MHQNRKPDIPRASDAKHKELFTLADDMCARLAMAWHEVDRYLRASKKRLPSSDDLASIYLPVLEELDLSTRHQLYAMHRNGSALRIESLKRVLDHPKQFSSDQFRLINLQFANDVFNHHCDLNWYEPVWQSSPPKIQKLKRIVFWELVPDSCYLIGRIEPSACHQLLACPPFYCTIRDGRMRVLPTWDYAGVLQVETDGRCMYIETE